jgi:hypothetical protein
VDKGNLVRAVFIDLSKAFDTLSNGVLLEKLQAYGIKGNELLWFTDYLFCRHQFVCIGVNLSPYEPAFSRVPQGSILGPLLFTVFYNDLADHLVNSRVIKYADDTVVYFSGKDVEAIEGALSQDLEEITRFFYQNELVINLKKGKTEIMLFGTGKRLSLQPHNVEVKYRGHSINFTMSYKYLGYTLDSCLALSENFNIAYKKASNCVRLLSKLRVYVTPKVAFKIYEMMILRIITYSTSIKPTLTRTQLAKLSSIENRVNEIVGREKHIPRLEKLIQKKACLTVRKCLDNDVCCNFQGYFETNNHNQRIRNNSKLVKLPNVKLEYARQSFRYVAAKIYNDHWTLIVFDLLCECIF